MSAARYPPPRVLLIEEHADTCELYSMWLTQCGFIVEVAGTAMAGLASARAAVPDVVVVELMVPGGGVSLLHEIRAVPALQSAVLVVLTTQARDQTRRDSLAAGADAYLVKPCGVPMLAEAMLAASRGRLAGGPASGGTATRQRAADLSEAIAERLVRDAHASRPLRPVAGH
ncbi:MAG: response regulator [Vicinamibacteraceae bacterium]